MPAILVPEIPAMKNLRAILALGAIAHNSVLTMLKLKKKDHAFAHGARYGAAGLAVSPAIIARATNQYRRAYRSDVRQRG